MKLERYLETKKIKISEFANMIGVSTEAVRLYVLAKRVPRAEIMRKIEGETKGAVRPNDFVSRIA